MQHILFGSFWLVSCDTSEGFFSKGFVMKSCRLRSSVDFRNSVAKELPGVKLLEKKTWLKNLKNGRYSNLLEGVFVKFQTFRMER